MPISRRPVDSKRRATRLWKDLDDIPPKPPPSLVVPRWFWRKPAQHFIPGGVLYTNTNTAVTYGIAITRFFTCYYRYLLRPLLLILLPGTTRVLCSVVLLPLLLCHYAIPLKPLLLIAITRFDMSVLLLLLPLPPLLLILLTGTTRVLSSAILLPHCYA